MLNVGLTGNVAAGKSSVADWFQAWGATIIDADAIVRSLQSAGSPMVHSIAEALGNEMIAPDGSLDRRRVRQLVTNDADALRALNAIVHPAVQSRRAALLEEARRRGDRIVVNDIPLLFEATDPAAFDVIVLVDAPSNLRKDRLVRKRGLSPEEADLLIAAQDPSGPKRSRSHFVIDNAGTPAELERAARSIWQELEARAGADSA